MSSGGAVSAQTVSIHVDAAKPAGPLRPVWAFFGHDEPNYTYMKNGKKLLSELAAAQSVPVYMRVRSSTSASVAFRFWSRAMDSLH